MKKAVCLLLGVCMLVMSTACGGNETARITSSGEDEFTFPISSDNATESEGDSSMQENSSAPAASSGNETPAAQNKIKATDQTVAFMGRTYEDDRYDTWFFNWTNSGFIVEFEGTKLTADFFSTAESRPEHEAAY